MGKKQFKAESKKLMDMMINSIYTHKEIFLRELISNASDALDKLYFRSLTDSTVTLNREDYRIKISADKENRILTVEDNGCGMSEKELESNLGTIAKSGSQEFKKENNGDDISVIGQFGVGFYSAFMVSDKVVVKSRVYGEDAAYCWTSSGTDGYTVEPCEKDTFGTEVILHLKADTDTEDYSKFLQQWTIQQLIKKYSDFIRYPIKMMWETPKKNEETGEMESYTEEKILNTMIPLWKRDKKDIKAEDYKDFYIKQFLDFEEPARVIHYNVEGATTFTSLLFIPKHVPYDYYTKEFEKGLQLYSQGVLVMEKCGDILPDYFSFVKGLIDSEDLSLNISREILQQDSQLKIIAKNVEKKISSELLKMQKEDRATYEEFFKNFGTQIKYGIYQDFGSHKEELKDLVMFTSSFDKKLTTLAEYVDRAKEGQNTIYYASGESVDKLDMLPQAELIKDKGYEILYLTEAVDEFAIQILASYKDKTFTNIASENLQIDTEEEKQELKSLNESEKELLDAMKEALSEKVNSVRFTNRLKSHPVCLISEGNLSLEMEKVLNTMPNPDGIKAKVIMEINKDHPIAEKLKTLQAAGDKETLKKYSELMYDRARLIEGLSIDNPTQFSNMICELMVK
jgi:molecular chaperone HtpG